MRNALVCGMVLLALAAGAATNMQAQEVQGAHLAARGENALS